MWDTWSSLRDAMTTKLDEPNRWLQHLLDVDLSLEFVQRGGSLLRVVSTGSPATHWSLVAALQSTSESEQLPLVQIGHGNCEKLQYPNKIVAAMGETVDLAALFRAIAHRAWRQLGYAGSSVTARDVSEVTGRSLMDLRSEFRFEVRRLLESGPPLSRDFRNVVPRVLDAVIDGPQAERNYVEPFRSYLRGLLSARDLYQLGVMKKVTRETATSTLRGLLALHSLTSTPGVVVHLDLRWGSDHELLSTKDRRILGPTKQARIWIYQWVRELIDTFDTFSSTIMIVEVGPSFGDPSFSGRGWGLYDALRLRLEDGVHPADGAPNLSAPYVAMGA
jgi:hypothetical protein